MINLAIQVLPLHTGSKEASYQVIDNAILLIKNSGLRYEVCPFETVIEGEYDEVMALVKSIKEQCIAQENASVIINLKLHANHSGLLSINDTMQAYR